MPELSCFNRAKSYVAVESRLHVLLRNAGLLVYPLESIPENQVGSNVVMVSGNPVRTVILTRMGITKGCAE